MTPTFRWPCTVPNWIKPGKYGDSEVVDLARTIAFILNVRPPNGCEGRVLSEALN